MSKEMDKVVSYASNGETVVEVPAEELVKFSYTNYRGVISIRTVRPFMMAHIANEWHPEKQWMLYAYDMDKGAIRTFAMKDIKNWRPA